MRNWENCRKCVLGAESENFSLPVEEVCLLVSNANSPPGGCCGAGGPFRKGLSGGSDFNENLFSLLPDPFKSYWILNLLPETLPEVDLT